MSPTRRRLPAILLAASALLWLAAGAAAATGLLGAHEHTAAAVPPGVAGVAELYVATYLASGEGTEARLAPLTTATPDLTGVPAEQRYAARAATTHVERRGPGRFEVTVGVDLLVADAGGYRRAGLRFLSVTILDRGGRLLAHGAPRSAHHTDPTSAGPRG